MQAILYYLALPFIYGISYLPFRLLYVLSDGLFIILYHVIGYRKKIVHRNLVNSFPDKSAEEIRQIQRKFYRYFCDLLLETLKTLTISPQKVRNMVSIEEEVFQQFYRNHQSIIIVMGHWGNWELAGARFSQANFHQLYVIFHPLSNPFFNKLVIHMRTRLGNKLYAMNETFRGMIRDRNQLTATAFIADQTPPPKGAYWTTFLNQETPIFTGTAKVAKKLKLPIVYTSVDRIKRGQYAIKGEVLIEDPTQFSEDDISERHTRRLEQDIVSKPEIWLWTHRRWKHKKTNF